MLLFLLFFLLFFRKFKGGKRLLGGKSRFGGRPLPPRSRKPEWNAHDLTIYKMHLFSQYNDHERNYKPVSDMWFLLILS